MNRSFLFSVSSVLCCSALFLSAAWGDVLPAPGYYEGTTSQGYSLSFDVTNDAKVEGFCISFDYFCESCSSNKEMCPPQQLPIEQSRFQYDTAAPNRFELGGRFITESIASGFLYYISDQLCGSCDNYITWDASCLGCAPLLLVLAPNGGERWIVGELDTIEWRSAGQISAVQIAYTFDGGASWVTVADSTANTGSYVWTVPNTPSSSCLVRVRDRSDPTVADVSDDPFSICAQPSITVLSPNGGERWGVGQEDTILWTWQGCIDGVTVEYSVDGGRRWTIIVDSAANTGRLVWPVPSTPSQECFVRISDASDSTVSDLSDQAFRICLPSLISVRSPNGGEEWMVGSSHPITWASTGCIDEVNIDYTVDGGANWTAVVSNAANTASYLWTVPNTPSLTCLVRVWDAADSTVADVSDGPFSICQQPALQVLWPNGGEVLIVGSIYTILWQSAGCIEDVAILYTDDGGQNWFTVSNETPNDGMFQWRVPNTPSHLCLVRIHASKDTALSDTSDSLFTIEPPPSLTVLVPNGGEEWWIGYTYEVAWEVSGTVTSVAIDYSTDGGTSWSVVAESTANSGAWEWIVPPTPSSLCLVRITDRLTGTVADTSDSFFAIAPAPELSLISPNGGELWVAGSDHDVLWSFSGSIDSVGMVYSFTGGDEWVLVVENTPNDGAYTWTVPETPSEECLGLIFDAANPGVADTSDSFFTIVPAPKLSLLSPNGGEMLAAGSRHDILWSSTGLISAVTIAYAVDGDSQWAIIVTNTPNDGSYTWKVPNTPSTQCLVRILDAADPAVADTSEGPFTILPLEVTLRVAGGSGSQGSVDNRVAIELENEASLGSLHFSLAYEPSVLAATNVVGTERTADMSRFWWDHSAPGSLSVTIDDGIVAAGVGPIAAVRFDVSGDGPPGGYPILLSDCALRDTLLKESFLCATEDGIFTVYPRPRFSIEGFVQDTRGDGLEGATITLMGDTSAVFTTSATGYYQFTQLVGGDYVVLPSKACWTFQPPLRRYISLNGNYDDQNFVGITLGRSFLSWSDAVLEDELTDGALEDTFAVWFGPGLPCSLHAVEAAFGSPGTVMIFVWEAGPDAPNDGIAPARGSFSGRPLGDVVAGPIPFTVQGTGDWERLEFDQHGPVPVFGGPEEPGRSFFVGWVKVVPGLFPHNVPHALGSNLFPKATHSWFGGPWTLPGGPDPKDYRWGGYDTETDSTPNFEYAVRVDLSFPWCPSVVSLGLPETVGVEGETLSVPVYVYSVVSGLNIFSYACEIGFDETLLDVVGCVSQADDMTRTWEEPVCETMTPGRVSVAQSGSSPLFGSGTLIHIRFRLLSSWRECSDLSFVSFSFNGGDPPVRSEDGRVCVEAGSQRCRISGYVLHYSNASPVAGATLVLSAGHSDTMSTDEAGFYLFDRLLCTLNDTVCATVTDYVSRGVTAYDAALVAQAAVGLRTLSPLQRVAGDASANCAVSAYDAALIAQRAAGLIFSLPAGPWVLIPEKVTVTQENWCTAPSCLTHTPLAMDRDGQDFVAVPVGDVSGNWSPTQGAMKRSWPVELFQNVTAHCGQGLTLPIFVGDDKGIVAVDLTFTYDPAVLCLDSVSQTDATKNFTMVLNPLPGCAQVCLFGPTSSGEKGPLLELKFTVIGERGDVSPLNVSRLLINEKPLTVAEAWLTVTGEAPETYWLEQNAPNPFNPSTSIQYSVVSDQSPTTSSQYSVVSEQFLPHVTLKIYNLLGQEVRTLVDEPKEPGYYSAVWDGRDEKGDKVSSGIYFYRLSMGSFVQTRRMVLLR